MKLFIISLLAIVALATGRNVEQIVPEYNTAYGYLTKIGIPEAERIRKAEEAYLSSKIVGGAPAALGEYPYQAGLISDIVGRPERGVCGGSLLTANKVVTAAHCWFDGLNQAWKFTVVLGSAMLFSGGTRVETGDVLPHPGSFPLLALNDIAMITLPEPVTLSATINVISLPSGSELENSFAGSNAIASGFGVTINNVGITAEQVLNFINLNVISNSVCSLALPLFIHDSHLCTDGIGSVGVCSGDSGGPLVITRENGDRTLIGITTFGSLGCLMNFPSVYTRVTSFMDFIKQEIEN